MKARHWIIGALVLVVLGAGVAGVIYAASTTTSPITQANHDIGASASVACTTEASTFLTAVNAYRTIHFGSPMPSTTSAFVHALTSGRTPLLLAPPKYLDAEHSTASGPGSPRPRTWVFNPARLTVDTDAC